MSPYYSDRAGLTTIDEVGFCPAGMRTLIGQFHRAASVGLVRIQQQHVVARPVHEHEIPFRSRPQAMRCDGSAAKGRRQVHQEAALTRS